MHDSTASLTAAADDDSFNWNNAAEQMLAGGLGSIPEVGALLSALVYIFWPSSGEDIWSQIEEQVQQLIEQDLNSLVESQVAASLEGLNSNLNSYLTALKDGGGDPSYISEKWNDANSDFLQQLPTFQLDGYQFLLLPLFAQFSNMHLSLLRDGVVAGSNWGWTPDIIAQTQADLTTAITNYTTYTQRIYDIYRLLQDTTPDNSHECQPFRTVNTFVRQMTLTVLDFMVMWPYFDVSKYPNGATVVNAREIYSDPQGTCDNSNSVGYVFLLPAPTQPIQQISVWGGDRIDSVQVSYPAGGGPNGYTTTPRMGTQSGSNNSPPHGGVFQVTANNPVTTATGLSGDIVNAMSFTFADGSSTGKLGGNYPGGGSFGWSFPDEILSSIYINGVSNYYLSANCVVFGFKFASSRTMNANVRRMLYVTNPVAPASPGSASDDAARVSYWKHIASKVKT